jgi:hypothetical protein
MKTQPGVFNAPQFGLPRDKVRVVKQPPRFTEGHATELAKLLRELERRDLTGVVRR